jgi:hypothetical protein
LQNDAQQGFGDKCRQAARTKLSALLRSRAMTPDFYATRRVKALPCEPGNSPRDFVEMTRFYRLL